MRKRIKTSIFIFRKPEIYPRRRTRACVISSASPSPNKVPLATDVFVLDSFVPSRDIAAAIFDVFNAVSRFLLRTVFSAAQLPRNYKRPSKLSTRRAHHLSRNRISLFVSRRNYPRVITRQGIFVRSKYIFFFSLRRRGAPLHITHPSGHYYSPYNRVASSLLCR